MKEALVPGLISLITAVVTYLLTRAKNKADLRKVEVETDSTELDTVTKVIAIWRGLAEELKNEVHALKVEVEALRKENHSLKADLKRLTKSIDNNTKN